MNARRKVSLVLVAATLCFAGPAFALPPGTMVILEAPVEAGTDGRQYEKDLKAKAKTSLAQTGDKRWHFFFVAYLKKAPGPGELNIVFYDLAEKKRVLGDAIAVALQAPPNAKTLASEVSISSEEGIKAGKTYEVLIARAVKGKDDIFARTTVELK
ncbi:MAG: hypothetical protein EXR72_26790 [Myxococcales bacterium]|nr:hypothetical protein [Myxococcales bacterium]